MSTAYDRLVRWRDVGDGPVGYCAGDTDFGNDVKALLAERADLLKIVREIVASQKDGCWETDRKWFAEEARTAIAKAKGRPMPHPNQTGGK